jgi:N utilization substance protein B
MFEKEKKSLRRILREKTLQILYAYEMNQEGLDRLSNGILADIENKEDREFSTALAHKVIANQRELDDVIEERLTNWEMNRIALMDRLLLRLGIAELLYFPDIPPKVSINEVIEIAKEYSTSKSGKFINGIMDAVLSNLRKAGKLNKTGRGLIEESLPKKSTDE